MEVGELVKGDEDSVDSAQGRLRWWRSAVYSFNDRYDLWCMIGVSEMDVLPG